ncbi:MAG: hypothetical protein JWL59_1390 [Chthoniobacteraceae bacterium]|nr:hypothetical protein [Chthoniobacteraceae bacterium]
MEFEAIRLRAINFDDKNENFSVFADYLVPHNAQPSLRPSDFDAILDDGQGLHSDGVASWYCTNWDIELKTIRPYSDHFDLDHYSFYNPHVGRFEAGIPRQDTIGYLAERGDRWNAV